MLNDNMHIAENLVEEKKTGVTWKNVHVFFGSLEHCFPHFQAEQTYKAFTASRVHGRYWTMLVPWEGNREIQ